MPVTSSKQQLKEALVLIGAVGLIDKDLKLLEDDDLLLWLLVLNTQRYLEPRICVPKSNHWLYHVLGDSNFGDKRFRNQLRMERESFGYVVELLKDSDVFLGTTEPVPTQLAVGISHLGTFGNGSNFANISTKFGISDGSVENFTNRTIAALNSVLPEWITWPDSAERKNIGSKSAMNFLPKCIGFIDGSEAILFNAPLDDKETYWSRKKNYSVQFQIVCDDARLIRHFYIGFPGSVHDSKVFNACEIGRHPEQFFSEGEFLIGDSAYPKMEFLVVPYKRYNTLTAKENTFNTHISKFRVAVEHTIGILKGRFQSLLGIRVRVDKEKGHEKVCKWVASCATLHNILAKIDPWNREGDNIHLERDDDDQQPPLTPSNCRNAGDLKRIALTEIVYAMYS